MPPFIPDVPYKVQAIFISVFFYIWYTAFVDDYNGEVPTEGEARTQILVRVHISLKIFRELIAGAV